MAFKPRNMRNRNGHGAGLQPSRGFGAVYLWRCHRLVWVAPLALGDMGAIEGHRPGSIPAWGNGLGIRSDIFPRAEGPRHSIFSNLRPACSDSWVGPLALASYCVGRFLWLSP